jgi:hypothetical protein
VAEPDGELDQGDDDPRARDEPDDRPCPDPLESRDDGDGNDEAGLY